MRKYIFGSKIDCDTFIQKFNEFQKGIDKDHHFGDDDFLSIHIYLNMLLGGVLK